MFTRTLFMSSAIAVTLLAQQPAPLGFVDQSFLQKVASSGKAEVATAKMGVARAANPSVRAFAQRLVDDHTKINAEIEALANRKAIPLDLNAAAGTDDLAVVQGEAFDHMFVEHMIRGHQRSIAEFEEQLKKSADPDVKSFIAATVPILRAHLDQAHSLKL